MAPVAAAIIAGGAATRLGGLSKSSLVVDGRSIAERLLEALRATFGRVLVVANDPAPWSGLGVEVTADLRPGAGPLAGVHAALAATAGHAGRRVRRGATCRSSRPPCSRSFVITPRARTRSLRGSRAGQSRCSRAGGTLACPSSKRVSRPARARRACSLRRRADDLARGAGAARRRSRAALVQST